MDFIFSVIHQDYLHIALFIYIMDKIVI